MNAFCVKWTQQIYILRTDIQVYYKKWSQTWSISVCHMAVFFFFLKIYLSLSHVMTHKSTPLPKISHARQAECGERLCTEHRAEGDFFEALLKAITIQVESTHDNWFTGSKWETITDRVGGGSGFRAYQRGKRRKKKKKGAGLAPCDSDKFHQSSSVKICPIFAVAHSGVGPHHSPIIWQQNIRGEQWARFS